MLKVLPIQSKDAQMVAAQKCNIQYKEDALAYEATVDDVFVGMCQFKTTENGGEIYDIATANGKNDFEALFVMGRAALNFIDLCGIHYAKFVGENVDATLLRAIGFTENEKGEFEIDLTDFFNHPCKCHKNENGYDTPKS